MECIPGERDRRLLLKLDWEAMHERARGDEYNVQAKIVENKNKIKIKRRDGQISPRTHHALVSSAWLRVQRVLTSPQYGVPPILAAAPL